VVASAVGSYLAECLSASRRCVRAWLAMTLLAVAAPLSACGGTEREIDPIATSQCLERRGASVNPGDPAQWEARGLSEAEVLEVLTPLDARSRTPGVIAIIFMDTDEAAREVEQRMIRLSPRGSELVRRKETAVIVWETLTAPPSADEREAVTGCV
jgi:hypothetical protein